MTGEQAPGTPPHEPRTALARLDIGNLTGDQWCADCKALTGFTADVVALHDGGVTVVGTVAGCVICMDEDGPEVRHG
jgi:hypothetical protein